MVPHTEYRCWLPVAAAVVLIAAFAVPADEAVAQDGPPSFDFDAMKKRVETREARQALEGCSEGNAEACYRLGDFYHGGDGLPRDNDLSVRLIDHACQESHVPACYEMGVRYFQGIEVEQDLEASRTYFESACTAGYAAACHMLGRAVENGLGGPRDIDRAARLFERSCRLGVSRDCRRELWPEARHVGTNEAQLPDGAPASLVDAARQCDSGLMNGCDRLADAYREGRALERDLERAHALYSTACDWGDLEACSVFRMMQAAGVGR